MKKHHGLTLFELLITIAIVGILLAAALPSFSKMIKDSKLVNTLNQVNALAAFARSEAIKRNNSVTLCRSADSSKCATSGNYIIIKSDSNNDGDFSDTDDVMLKTLEFSESGSDMTLNFQGFTSKQIIFTPNGSPTKIGSMVVCDSRRKAHARAIFINMGGQLRIMNSDSATSNTERTSISCG